MRDPTMLEDCVACNGTGYVGERECDICDGTGEVTSRENAQYIKDERAAERGDNYNEEHL